MPSSMVAWMKSLFGYDTTKKRVYEVERKRYCVDKGRGSVCLEGHISYWKNGDFVLEEANDNVWAIGTIVGQPVESMKPLSGEGFDEVGRVEGAEDVEEEIVGTDRWIITVDVASLDFVNSERAFSPSSS
jgi:hypothetical protein